MAKSGKAGESLSWRNTDLTGWERSVSSLCSESQEEGDEARQTQGS